MRSEPLDTSADLTVVTRPGPDDGGPGDMPILTVEAQRKRGKLAAFFAETPLALVICGVGVGLIIIALHHFRWGNLAISISVLGGALLRLVLPSRRAGLLAVRTRFTDVVTMGLIGGALMVLAAVTST